MGGFSIARGARPQLTERANNWRTVPPPKAIEVVQALSSPVRAVILKLLEKGPIRQYELAKIMREITGKKYDDTVLRYHLQQLRRAGIIDSQTDRNSAARVKKIYLAADVRVIRRSTTGLFNVRLRPRPAPAIPMLCSENCEEREELIRVGRHMLNDMLRESPSDIS
jgi:DNA-binding transcriptional ArsR family regulator